METMEETMSLPVREVWIEIRPRHCHSRFVKSLPVREVWIEIITDHHSFCYLVFVTSREGSVD